MLCEVFAYLTFSRKMGHAVCLMYIIFLRMWKHWLTMGIKPFGARIKCPGYSAKDLGLNGHPLLCMILVNLQHQSAEVNSAPATAET